MGAAHTQMAQWVLDNYPGEELVLWGGLGFPSGTDEALALWPIRVAEFVDTL